MRTTKNFKTHNDGIDNSLSVGTSFVGEINNIYYSDIVDVLGEPLPEGLFDDYKIDAEWIILFDDGSVATLYNWKNGKNYNGDYGYETDEIYEWNIGGHSDAVVELVKQLFK